MLLPSACAERIPSFNENWFELSSAYYSERGTTKGLVYCHQFDAAVTCRHLPLHTVERTRPFPSFFPSSCQVSAIRHAKRSWGSWVFYMHHFPLAHAHEIDVSKTAAKRVDEEVHACILPSETHLTHSTVLSLC